MAAPVREEAGRAVPLIAQRGEAPNSAGEDASDTVKQLGAPAARGIVAVPEAGSCWLRSFLDRGREESAVAARR